MGIKFCLQYFHTSVIFAISQAAAEVSLTPLFTLGLITVVGYSCPILVFTPWYPYVTLFRH